MCDACIPVSSLLSRHCSANWFNHLQWMLLSNTNTTLVRIFWFAFCVFYFLNICFLPFCFLWLAQRQLTGWKKLKESGLLWRLVPEFSLRSVTVSLCTSGVFTNVFSVNYPSRETRPGLCQIDCLISELVFHADTITSARMNKPKIAPLGLLISHSRLAGFSPLLWVWVEEQMPSAQV